MAAQTSCYEAGVLMGQTANSFTATKLSALTVQLVPFKAHRGVAALWDLTHIKGANLRADNRGKASVSGESAGIIGIWGDIKRSGNFRNHQTQTSQSPNTNIAITENTNIAIAS